MPETIKSLKQHLKLVQEQLGREQRHFQSRDDEQRTTIRREREINVRLTQEKFSLEAKLRRYEDQRRAVLLVLEDPTTTQPTTLKDLAARYCRDDAAATLSNYRADTPR